ncbi:MAG: preprotein translocase subunit SecE [Lachnospiraceae bacterium]|jgi:preprotein translocase subunit SecE
MAESKKKARKGSKITGFFKNVSLEFQKIVWPSGRQLTKESAAVLLISVALGAVIALIDFGLRAGIEVLIQ